MKQIDGTRHRTINGVVYERAVERVSDDGAVLTVEWRRVGVVGGQRVARTGKPWEKACEPMLVEDSDGQG